ncbi:hypothetical protein FDW81_16885 [Pseudarthrobacter sp. NamB4]|nr:hypothetical protein FDW81_16885 [Pseudarthrobacter sp. NamB4]
METSDYARFVQDCIAADTLCDHRIKEDELYGLYLSWCFLHRQQPASCTSFWAAMSKMGVHERTGSTSRYLRPGLRMTGPAAVDYILTSRPSLV